MQGDLLHFFNQIWAAILLMIPLILVAKALVMGTRYSFMLFVVVFGLDMGFLLEYTGIASPGMPELQIVEIISNTSIIPLVCFFFLGGQELRKIFGKEHIPPHDLVAPCTEEITYGTTTTQLIYIGRSFFLLLGIIATFKMLVGIQASGFYLLLAYTGLFMAIIIFDYRKKIISKRLYMRKGIIEIAGIILILVVTFYITRFVNHYIRFPQIFFTMLVSCTLGAIFYKWTLGPTIRSLLFAGLPIVLSATFLIGGSRFSEVLNISGMNSVMAFGFFGQIIWMFGGISLLILFGKTNHVRNLAPGLAGSLSHAGLTSACSAGEFGPIAETRTPIMVNMPFIAHIFVFSILAFSATQGHLTLIPSIIVLAAGLGLTILAFKKFRKARGDENKEVQGLMLFSLGWQLTAMFGGFILLSLSGMSLDKTAVAVTSSLSHFGLFSATQEGMFGPDIANFLPFVFAMPFMVHPFVFFFFGKAMAKEGHMPKLPMFILSLIGVAGVAFSLLFM